MNIDSARVEYRVPLRCTCMWPLYVCVNSRLIRYSRGQPLYCGALLASVLGLIVALVAHSDSAKPVDLFQFGLSLGFIAALLCVWITFHSLLRDCKFGCYSTPTEGCCRVLSPSGRIGMSSTTPYWYEPSAPPPRMGGSDRAPDPDFPPDMEEKIAGRAAASGGGSVPSGMYSAADAKDDRPISLTFSQQELLEREEMEREERRLRGGRVLCCGITLRTVVFAILTGTAGLGIYAGCGSAAWWVNWQGVQDIPIGECDPVGRWWSRLTCEVYNGTCVNTPTSQPTITGNAALPFNCPPDVPPYPPAVIDSLMSGRSIASSGATLATAALQMRKLSDGNETSTESPGDIPTLSEGAKARIARARLLAETDISCGLCKSSFLPSLRACEVMKFFLTILLIVAFFVGAAPALPVPWCRYNVRPICELQLLAPSGLVLVRCNVGDPRNAAAAIECVQRHRILLVADLLRSGHHGTNLPGPQWNKGEGVAGSVATAASNAGDAIQNVARMAMQLITRLIM